MRILLAILSLIGAQWAAPALAQQAASQSQPATEREPAAEADAPAYLFGRNTVKTYFANTSRPTN